MKHLYIFEIKGVFPDSGPPGGSLKRIAPSTGQASKHSPHWRHRSRMMTAFPLYIPMISGGQARAQAPHPVHR